MGALTMLEEPRTTRLEVGVASHPLVPRAECGDAWAIEPIAGGFTVAAVDGLGHGREAARAARRAIAAISQSAADPPEGILTSCHRALVGTRGAAISIAQIDLGQQRLAWLGVGNVEGLLMIPTAYRPPTWQRETLVVRGGVVGYELPRLQSSYLPFGPGAFLVFATDGIKQGFSDEIRASSHPQAIAEGIMAGYDRGTDDALVLVVQQLWGATHQKS